MSCNSGYVLLGGVCKVTPLAAGGLTLTQGQSATFDGLALVMQSDGNLVLYQGTTALWSTGAGGNNCGTNQCAAVFQDDGNLVVYDDSTVLWNSQTWGETGSQLMLSPNPPYLQIVNSGFLRWSATLPNSDPSGLIDTADYLFSKHVDVGAPNWFLIGGEQSQPAVDPEGNGLSTYVVHKFSSQQAYEVYYVNNDSVQLRYEVGQNGGSNIRRFAEINENSGAVILGRYLNPGNSPSYLSHFSLDNLVYDGSQYVISDTDSYTNGAANNMVSWVNIDWGGKNFTGLNLNHVLRVSTDEHGGVLEDYDYARYVGIVNWRFNEPINFFLQNYKIKDSNGIPGLYSCERNTVQLVPDVQSVGPNDTPPEIYFYDMASGKRGEKLIPYQRVSIWGGTQWYVTCYESAKDVGAVRTGPQYFPVIYSLPLGDQQKLLNSLPFKYTSPIH